MLSVFIAALPALFMWEFAAIKVNLRLPKTARKRLFKLGGRFALLALVIELLERLIPLHGLPPLAHAMAQAGMAAVPEELVKFAAVNRFGRKELDETGPGIAILLAVGASLGFAVLENKLSVFGGGIGVWFVRALTAVPMHAMFGFVMGSFMTLAWRNPLKFDENALALALLVPMLFHFGYDFPLFLEQYNPHLAWPRDVQPVLMVVEGIFALILTNHAVNGATAIYGKRDPVDPNGHRALGFAGFSLTLVVLLAFVDLHFSYGAQFAMLAAVPVVLTLDLALLAYVRSTGILA